MAKQKVLAPYTVKEKKKDKKIDDLNIFQKSLNKLNILGKLVVLYLFQFCHVFRSFTRLTRIPSLRM